MGFKSVAVDSKAKTLTVVMDLESRPSKSGKTTVVASTNGNQPTTATIDGKVVILGVNAYVK